MYRAKRVVDNFMIRGHLSESGDRLYINTMIDGKKCRCLIKPETIEIFIFGQWILYSELESKYDLVEKQEYEQIKNKAFMFDNGIVGEDMKDDTKNDHL